MKITPSVPQVAITNMPSIRLMTFSRPKMSAVLPNSHGRGITRV
jgi:hypothetical protein